MKFMLRFCACYVALFASLELRAQSANPPESTPPAAAIALPISSTLKAPEMKWNGDIRLREQLEKADDGEARSSTRIRVRFGVGILLQEDLRVEIRLASAKSNRSTNQSLGDSSEAGARRRFVGIDLAYAEYTPVKFAKLYVGRHPQVHFRPGDSQLILDDDMTLEGAAITTEHEFIPHWSAFGSLGSAYIRENYDNYYSEDMADNMLNYGQAGILWAKGSRKARVGGGFFNFTSVRGRNFADLALGGKANGNSEDTAGVVKSPFLPRQYFIDWREKFGATDVVLFYENIENPETSDPNRAFWTGVSVGGKSWDTQLAYSEVESDAVLAMFTNSDFGNGTSDLKGWVGAARWKFMKNMNVRFTQMVARTDMSGLNKEYRRSHLDLSASF